MRTSLFNEAGRRRSPFLPLMVQGAMAIGFVLVSTRPGSERDVYNSLLKLPQVQELHPLFGEYDLIVKLESDDFDSLGHTIVTQIRSIDGVQETKTLTGTRF